MDLIANLLESAKAKACIESDYRLAKVIGITHSAVSNYRMGKTMPDERVLSQLCALSGDDAAIVAAQVQALRARTPEGKTLWAMVAARLQSDRRKGVREVSTAILSVLFTMVLVAGYAGEARAAARFDLKSDLQAVYTSYKVRFLSVCAALRLRWRGRFPGLLGLRGAFMLFY